MKHTPGPWKLPLGIGGTGFSGIVESADGTAVAALCNYRPDQTLPNARLIAAAPDLLAEVWARFIECGKAGANADVNHPLRAEWERLRDLIAKAQS